MKRLKRFLLITGIISITVGPGLRILTPEKGINEMVFLNEVAPSVKFSTKGGSPPHYSSKEGIVAFNTYDVVPSIRGYTGPIKMLLTLSSDGRITGIRILEHKETKNYVHYMETPEYLSQFLGKGINDPFEIDKDIDGISRATVSVKAMADTIRESSRLVASNIMGIRVAGGKAKGGLKIQPLIYLLLFAFSFAGYLISKRERRFLRLRDVSLILSIIIIGSWLSVPFSILHVFNLLFLRFSSDMLWYVVVFSTILSVFIAGRFYCGWLCPFGAVAEFIGRLPFKKWDISTNMDDRWRNLKYILLWLVIIVVFVSGRVEFGNYEAYVTLFSLHGNILTWSLVLIAILANIRIDRFWCRYLCPVGALTGIPSRRDSGYVSRHDCPMSNSPMPLAYECIRCNRCYERRR